MSSKKPFPYREFKKIYSKVPRLSVDVIVKSPKGIALTLRSIPSYQNKWHIPGSTVLYGESILETVHRSAREELSVSIRAPKFLGYIEYDEKAHGGFGQIVGLVFMAQLKSGQLVPDKDATKAAFFRKLPPNIIPVQKAFLKKHWVEIMKK